MLVALSSFLDIRRQDNEKTCIRNGNSGRDTLGSMGIFVRKFEECGLGSLDIAAIRAITTMCILFLFLLFYNRSLLRIKLRDLWCFLGTGLLSIVFFNYCYFRAITMTSLSVAAVLLYTAPAFVMILSYLLFHEKFTVRKSIALVLTFVGCVFVTGINWTPCQGHSKFFRSIG